ncbi:MAG: hypothetical protein RIC36_13400 [Rhodospirillales bacterium]
MYKIPIIFLTCLTMAGCSSVNYGTGPLTLSPEVQAGVERAMNSYVTDTIAVSTDGKHMSVVVCNAGIGVCEGNAVEMAIRSCSMRASKCYVYARGSTIVWDFDAKPRS